MFGTWPYPYTPETEYSHGAAVSIDLIKKNQCGEKNPTYLTAQIRDSKGGRGLEIYLSTAEKLKVIC